LKPTRIGEKGSNRYSCAGTLAGGVCLPGLTFLPAGVTGTSLTVERSLEGLAPCAVAPAC
jgi:outer membrane immunogenic protein